MRAFWQSDARDIPDEAMSYIRALAVRAIRERGYSPELIAEVYGRIVPGGNARRIKRS